MKCVIIDDDPIAATVIEDLVAKTPFLELSHSFGDPLEAVEYLNEAGVDLVFLDIEMPKLSGLDLMKVLSEQQKVIVTSSKKDYALDAFDFNVVDYLLKPVTDYARFLKAVNKAKEANHTVQTTPTPGNVFVKVDSLLVSLDLEEILYVEAFGDYIKIHTQNKAYVVYSTLKAVESKLPNELFQRVHRSYVINLKKVSNIDHGNLQVNDKIIPISNSYREALMGRLNML